MKSLTEQQILHLWEVSQRLHPMDKALNILIMAFPENTWEEIASLSKGQRDTLLFLVRAKLFGTRFTCLTQCEACNDQMEVSFDSQDMGIPDKLENGQTEFCLEAQNYEINFRLPNSYDLAAIVDCNSVEEAKQRILTRCVLKVNKGEKRFSPKRLPKKAIYALTLKMAEIDPLAEIRLDLHCNMCDHRWDVNFEIVSHLWNEISMFANRLLYEIHLLARYYGWNEVDILSMSQFRRQKYMEMMH